MAAKRYFEEFQVGETLTSHGRLMTDADIRLLIGCAGGDHPLHTDPIYCATRPDVRKPILQGTLVMGASDGFFVNSICPDGVLVLHYGYEKVRFIKPVYTGDTVYTKFELIDSQIKNDEFGILTFNATTYNQNDVPVLFQVEKFYVERKTQK